MGNRIKFQPEITINNPIYAECVIPNPEVANPAHVVYESQINT